MHRPDTMRAEKAAYLAAHTLQQAADTYGCTLSTALRWRRQLGIPEQLRGSGNPIKKLFWADVAAYLRAHPAGCTEARVARHFQVSRQAVSLRFLRWAALRWLERTAQGADGRVLGWIVAPPALGAGGQETVCPPPVR
jgi:hypothetical protein